LNIYRMPRLPVQVADILRFRRHAGNVGAIDGPNDIFQAGAIVEHPLDAKAGLNTKI